MIEEMRSRIDGITLEMLSLLHERTELSKSIGAEKRNAGAPISDENRERQLRSMVSSHARNIGLEEGTASRFLNHILNESHAVQASPNTHLSVFHRAKRLEMEGKSIIHMEVGEPDFGPPEAVTEALCRSVAAGYKRYGSPKGRAELRLKIADRHDATPDNVMVVPGGRFAVFSAISTLLNAGDEVIITEPAWPAYREAALYAGAKITTIQAAFEDGWSPDPVAVESAITPNTKMIVLNYPNNPTGKVLDPKTQDHIMQTAMQNDLYVMSDEIYQNYSKRPAKSASEYRYDKAITVQSFSKSHAMTGFRIGYVVAAETITDRMARLAGLCMTSVAEPVQYAALAALDCDVSGNAATIRGRLELLEREADRIGLRYMRPDGAMYLFATTDSSLDGTKLADAALERGVAIAPGEGFGRKEFVRISACSDTNTLKRGMEILEQSIWQKRG